MASSASTFIPRVLSGYRRLFRARNSLFTGDVRAMVESRVAIRAEFDANKHVTDQTQMEGLLLMIDEAEDMLLNGIMRGELNPEKGAYEVKIKSEHADSSDSGSATTIEPITSETANNTSNNPKVVITSSSCKSNHTTDDKK
mmetsp:Transcript_2099/g.2290  ORF Transcript_2099/g.2290 Transcript_2099/m.2290 type:complete len:142 (-) Transcript_2099:348-773(-)